jgi:hypothetical protein
MSAIPIPAVHHSLLAHPAARGPHCRERGGQHNRRRALHVVVERAHLVGVLVQDPPRVGDAEVFPVQHRVREQLRRCRDVGVDQLVIALIAHPGVPVPQIHLIVQ